MRGPHCPKCGYHNGWAPYANGDALRCENEDTKAIQCGYIHWLRNAPADAPRIPGSNQIDVAHDRVLKKRLRVRALVHVMLQSAQPLPTRGGIVDVDAYVRVAEHIDAAIEAIGVTKDES